MGNNWKKIPLGELISLQRGHDLPSQNRVDGPIPIMGSSGLTGWHDTSKSSGPGVVIGRSGNSMGVVSYSESDFWPLNTCLYVTDFKGNDERYIYYMLQQIDFDQFNSGSAQKSLNRNAVYPYEVTATTDVNEQRRIGKLLANFENKISINCQINQTLEQMAQELFKSWFVDFDPVVDNALDAGFFEQDLAFPDELLRRTEARRIVREHRDFKSLPDATRQLFPAAFEECEEPSLGLGGWVPKGWGIHAISDIAFINKESWTKNNAPENIKYVDLSNAKDGMILDIQEFSFEEAPSRARRILKKRDTIFGMVRPANRSFAYVDRDGLTGSTGFVVISAKNKNASSFVYQKLTSDSVLDDLIRVADGAAYPAIKPDDISELMMAVPRKCILDLFEKTIDGYRERVSHNLENNEQLANLRDTLLPKLISGELRLDNIEAALTKVEVA